RYISAPKPALAQAQRWLFVNILSRLEVEAPAHGFVPCCSIVTNAAPHTGRKIVINLDLKDFFPSITFRRVKGLFEKLGYSEHVATVLALLSTEPPRVATELDGKVYHVALGQRVLLQGACTSPAITNALCRRLDRRLSGLAKRHGFAYTRYADDLTFSGDNAAADTGDAIPLRHQRRPARCEQHARRRGHHRHRLAVRPLQEVDLSDRLPRRDGCPQIDQGLVDAGLGGEAVIVPAQRLQPAR